MNQINSLEISAARPSETILKFQKFIVFYDSCFLLIFQFKRLKEEKVECSVL